MAPLIRIESVYGRETATIVEVDSGIISIGREPDNTVIVDSVAVSRHHGVLLPAGDHWVYRDLGSSNGSFINDIPVVSGDYKLIKNGDLIRISNFTVRIVYLDDIDIHKPSLLIFKHDEFQKEYTICADKNFEAGGDEAAITLEGENNNNILFCIYEKNERLYIQINQIKGHLIINGTVGRGLVALGNGDQISVGLYKIIVNYPISIPEMKESIVEIEADQDESFVEESTQITDTETLSDDNEKVVQMEEHHQVETEVKPIRAYSRQTLHDHESAEIKESDQDVWKDESARRKRLVDKKLIFGKTEEDDLGTLSMPVDEFQYHSGLNMSMSQRMSVVSQQKNANVISEQILFFLGALVVTVSVFVAIKFLL